MLNIPLNTALPMRPLESQPWSQYFQGLLNNTAPLSEPVYDADLRITLAWANRLTGAAPAPTYAKFVDENKLVTMPWIQYLMSLS